MYQKKDLRVEKTIKNIQSAFVNLILTMDYHKITIKAVCDIAMINKKTFYYHYKTLDDLLMQMQQNFLNEFSKKIEKYKVPDDLYKINEEFFKYSLSKGKVYEKIMCSKNYFALSKKLTQNFVESAWGKFISDKNDESKMNFLVLFLQNTGLELYREWVYSGKKLSLKEITKISGELLCNGINGFLKL